MSAVCGSARSHQREHGDNTLVSDGLKRLFNTC